MRTASKPRRRPTPVLPVPHRSPAARPAPGRGQRSITQPLCAAAFLAAYPLGMWQGSQGGEYAVQLAGHILSPESYTAWQSVAAALLSGTFLTLLCVFAAGFCAVGTGLLCLVFAVQGGYLGFCAAAVCLQNGAKALLVYRALLSFPELATLALCLWLARYAGRLCAGLNQSIFAGGAARGRLQADVRRLTLRFLLAAALSVGVSAVGAGVAVFAAGILL